MVTHMKTTVEIADALLEEAKKEASRRGTTLRALVEAGLREVLRNHRSERKPFRLRDESFGGGGLTPEFEAGGWEAIRDAIYEGRGG